MVGQADVKGLRVGRDISAIWITSFMDHLLLHREVMENNNHKPFCNDKSKTLPVVNESFSYGRLRGDKNTRGSRWLSHYSISDGAL